MCLAKQRRGTFAAGVRSTARTRHISFSCLRVCLLPPPTLFPRSFSPFRRDDNATDVAARFRDPGVSVSGPREDIIKYFLASSRLRPARFVANTQAASESASGRVPCPLPLSPRNFPERIRSQIRSPNIRSRLRYGFRPLSPTRFTSRGSASGRRGGGRGTPLRALVIAGACVYLASERRAGIIYNAR